MSINIKPHSSEPVAQLEKDSMGKDVFRFTDAWYNYFEAIDQEINVTVNQTIVNNSSSLSTGSTATTEVAIDELDRQVNALSSLVTTFVYEPRLSQDDVLNLSSPYPPEVQEDLRPEISTKAEKSHTHAMLDVADLNPKTIARTDSAAFTQPPILPAYTVATLPSASASQYGIIIVTDDASGPVLAYSDGTNWLRASSSAIVS